MNITEKENRKLTLEAKLTDINGEEIGVLSANLSNSSGDASNISITLYNFEKFTQKLEDNKISIDTFMSRIFEKIDELNIENK